MKKLSLILITVLVMLTVSLVACNDATATVTGIEIVTQPAKTAYTAGESFDPAGMEVVAVMNDGTSTPISDYIYAPKGALTSDDKQITVIYTANGKNLYATVGISVSGGAAGILSAPQVVAEGNVIRWTAVEGASYYEIYVNDVKVNAVTETSYTVELATGAYKINVVAVKGGGSQAVRSEKSVTVTCIVGENALSSPFATLDYNVVSWNSVEGAERYEVCVNGVTEAEVTETFYKLNYTQTGVYDVKIKAKTSVSGINESKYSNVVQYIVRVDLTRPVVLVSANGKVVTCGADGYLVEGDEYSEDIVYGDEALLIETVDDCVYLRKADGTYLVYADGAGVLENRTYVFSDKLNRSEDDFAWSLIEVNGTADKFRIANRALSAECYLSAVDGEIRVDRVSSAVAPLSEYVFTIAYANVATSDFAAAQETVQTDFDFTKPFVMQFSSLEADNYYLGIQPLAEGVLSDVVDFLSEKTGYMKYAPLSLTGKNIFAFEPVTGYSAAAAYNPEGAELYRIRTYDGRYLGIAKGNYFFGPGINDYVAAVEFNEQDFSQVWSVIYKSDGVVRIQNMSYNYDWNILGSQGQLNAYLTNLNADNGQTGMAIYQASYDTYYDIILTNVDVAMQPVYHSDLDGVNATVSYLGYGDRGLTLGENNVLQVALNDGSSAFEFTFEAAAVADENRAYRIKTSDGKYLTFDAWYQISAQDKNENSDAQLFVLLPVCGMENAYLICPYVTGKTIDSVDGQGKYNCLFVNDENINHAQLAADDFMRVYNEYGIFEYRNYLQRIWVINTVA